MICRTAVELAGRSLDAPLPPGKRAGLAVHTLFCGPCRRFRRHGPPPPGRAREVAPDGAMLSAAARERLTAALDRLAAG